jgi:hypothetical protein
LEVVSFGRNIRNKCNNTVIILGPVQ